MSRLQKWWALSSACTTCMYMACKAALGGILLPLSIYFFFYSFLLYLLSSSYYVDYARVITQIKCGIVIRLD